MQRMIVIALSIVAVLVYSWNVWSLINPQWSSGDKKSDDDEQVALILYSIPERFTFSEVKRSPFEASLPKPKAKRVAPKPKPKPKTVIKPPRITINGIMWNSKRPLAMIKLPNGTSKMVKVGDELLGRITIKNIERTRVQVLYKEQLFWIDK